MLFISKALLIVAKHSPDRDCRVQLYYVKLFVIRRIFVGVRNGHAKQVVAARRVLTVFAALVFCVVLAAGVLLGSLWLEHSFRMELPKPTGPFAVSSRRV
jgi:hypothetical protein